MAQWLSTSWFTFQDPSPQKRKKEENYNDTLGKNLTQKQKKQRNKETKDRQKRIAKTADINPTL